MLWIEKPYTKIACISDPHGHKKTLEALLAKIPSDYKVILLGDLVDKGKDAKGVVALSKNYDCVLGNHDMLMTVESHPRYWKRYESIWLMNNGKDTMKSYGDKWKILNSSEHKTQFHQDVVYLKSLPLVIELPNLVVKGKKVLLSHSTIGPAITFFGSVEALKEVLNTTPRQELLGTHLRPEREGALIPTKEGMVQSILWTVVDEPSVIPATGFFNVMGHTVQNEGIRFSEEGALIDAGVYRNSRMQALLLPDLTVIEQEALPD